MSLCPRYLWTQWPKISFSSQCIDGSDSVIIYVDRDYNLKSYSLPKYRQPVRQYQGVCSFVWITSVISSKYIYWKWEQSTVVCLPATTAGRRMATQLRFHSNRCLSFGKCALYVIYLNFRIKICQHGITKKLASCSGTGLKNTSQQGLRVAGVIFWVLSQKNQFVSNSRRLGFAVRQRSDNIICWCLISAENRLGIEILVSKTLTCYQTSRYHI